MNMLLKCLKFPRFNLDMNNNLFHPAIEDPNEVAVPACPDFSSGIFWWDRIIRLLNFNMTIPMDRTFGLLEAWESAGRKWQQAGFFFFEQLAYLFASSTVNTRVSYVCLPVEQMPVLLLQA